MKKNFDFTKLKLSTHGFKRCTERIKLKAKTEMLMEIEIKNIIRKSYETNHHFVQNDDLYILHQQQNNDKSFYFILDKKKMFLKTYTPMSSKKKVDVLK